MLLFQDIDGHVDDEANEGKEESSGDKRKSPFCEIGSKGQNYEHNSTANVGSHGIQVGLDGRESKPRHDLRQEKRDTLQRNTQAYLDG